MPKEICPDQRIITTTCQRRFALETDYKYRILPKEICPNERILTITINCQRRFALIIPKETLKNCNYKMPKEICPETKSHILIAKGDLPQHQHTNYYMPKEICPKTNTPTINCQRRFALVRKSFSQLLSLPKPICPKTQNTPNVSAVDEYPYIEL